MKRVLRRALPCVLAFLALQSTRAQTPPPPDLTTLQIEDLLNVKVTSASRKSQQLSRVPAAVFVITAEDIRRAQATNIPDLLRMVPGLEVAQINASTWAISARGFNGQYSNKLLVLIDGRTVYTPIFSQVFWDAQDVPVDTIERIEIIRGPGAAVWGVNAVNGVINIITKTAQQTAGVFATATAGTLQPFSGMVRYGGRLGNRGAYRIAADGFAIENLRTPSGENGEDDWHLYQGTFRADETRSSRDSLTFEAGALSGNEGELATSIVSIEPPVTSVVTLRDHFSEGDVLAGWRRKLSPNSETSLQAYYDRSVRNDTTYGVALNRFDLDFQHHLHWRRHDFVWGLGYRLSSDNTAKDLRISFSPRKLNTQIFSAFFQDEVSLRPDRLSLIVGARLEHEYYNGFNLQPTARLAWTPDAHNTLWVAISGAQRTPSRVETTIHFDRVAYAGVGGIPTLVSLFGNAHQKNERLTATEAGLRRIVTNRLSIDSTVFFNEYGALQTDEPGAPRLVQTPAPTHILIPYKFGNLEHGETHGLELFTNLQLAHRWTLSPGYSFLTLHLHSDAGSLDLTTGPDAEGGIPNQQAQLRSNVNFPKELYWTTSAYFVGRLAAPSIPSYTRLDSNLTWQAGEGLSLSVAGQNLLRNAHQEFDGPDLTVQPSLLRRSGHVSIAWRF